MLLLLLALLQQPTNLCRDEVTGRIVVCPPEKKHLRVGVVGGMVRPFTPSQDDSGSVKPMLNLYVEAPLTSLEMSGPRLDVRLSLTAESSQALTLSDPATVNALEGSIALVQSLGSHLWFSMYGEVGGSALVGAEASPAFVGGGFQFETDSREADLRVGYSRDQRLSRDWRHAISISGRVMLPGVEKAGIAMTLGGDYLRSLEAQRAISRVRLWIGAGWGNE